MIAKILVNLCTIKVAYSKTAIDLMIIESKFCEKRELKKIKKMVQETPSKVLLNIADEVLIEIIKSKTLLRAIINELL